MHLQLETIHISRATSSFRFFKLEQSRFDAHWHYHPELELTFISKGQGIRFSGDHVASYENGDLVLVGEYLPHNWVSTNSDTAKKSIAYVFQFEKKLFDPFPECSIFSNLFEEASYGLHFTKSSDDIIRAIENMDQLEPLRQLITFMQVLHALCKNKNYKRLSSISYNRHIASKSQNKISKVTKYILDRMEEPLSLTEVASYSGMTDSSFCRWFKQSVGNSFVTYLNLARIEKACQHLIQTDWSISEIAFHSGFETIGHFNRVFKKIKKVSPSSYRKSFLS